MFEMTAETYISAIGFVGMPGYDWTGYLYKPTAAAAEWVLAYRHRYYKGENEDPFLDHDEKQWWSMRHKGPEAEALPRFRRFVQAYGARTGAPLVECVEIGGGQELMIKKLIGKRWFHVKADDPAVRKNSDWLVDAEAIAKSVGPADQ